MTDIISTTPITIRRPVFPSLKFPRLGIGRALIGVLKNYGHALNLAYVQPFRSDRGQLPVALEGSEKDRDPF